jgi:hypothetical protein
MASLGPPLLAFAVAAVIATMELITSRYARTLSLLKSCPTLYGYGVIYGLISVAVLLALQSLVKTGSVSVEGLDLSNPWMRAILVGVTLKAFLHLSLFTVTVGSDSVPVGIETLVQLFEPLLLRGIDEYHYCAVQDLIATRAARYNNLSNVKNLILNSTPKFLPTQQQGSFPHDVNGAQTVEEAMEVCLTVLGKRIFEKLFP